MVLFVKNNYLRLLILFFLIWIFSSCASSKITVEKLEENQKVKEENYKDYCKIERGEGCYKFFLKKNS